MWRLDRFCKPRLAVFHNLGYSGGLRRFSDANYSPILSSPVLALRYCMSILSGILSITWRP